MQPSIPPVSLITIDAVAFEDGNGMWFGQCIQHDIAAYAESLPKLSKALEKQVVATLILNERAGRHGLEGIPPAPEKFVVAFKAGEIGLSPSYKTKNVDSTRRVHFHDIKVVEAVS